MPARSLGTVSFGRLWKLRLALSTWWRVACAHRSIVVAVLGLHAVLRWAFGPPLRCGITIESPSNDQKAGLRRYTLYRRTRTPAEGRGGVGATYTVVDTPLPLTEKPRVRRATTKDVVYGGGKVAIGDWIIEAITRQSDSTLIGTPASFFHAQPASPGQEVLFVRAAVDPDGDDVPAYVAGPPPSGGKEFTLSWLDATKTFSLRAILTPRTGSV